MASSPICEWLKMEKEGEDKKMNSEMEFKYYFHFNTFLLCHIFSNFLKIESSIENKYLYDNCSQEKICTLVVQTFIHT